MRGLLAVGLICLLGCAPSGAAWSVDEVPTPLPPEERVEVATVQGRYFLHQVTLDPDSLRGVRWGHPPTCDSCRVTLARSAVRTVRLSPEETDEYTKFLIALAAIFLIVKTFPRPT